MAEKTIPQLTEFISDIQDETLIPIDSGTQSYKATASQVADYVLTKVDEDTITVDDDGNLSLQNPATVDIVTEGRLMADLGVYPSAGPGSRAYMTAPDNKSVHVVEADGSPAFAVAVGEETFRIVRGSILGNGTTDVGSGFTSAKTDTGDYSVTFDIGYPFSPAVVVTPHTNTNNPFFAKLSFTATGSFGVNIYDSSGTSTDLGFDFIAIGPR